MDETTFCNWFKNVFLKHISTDPAKLLIYDGHLSHISIQLIQLAISHNVTILKLPPHTSHILQPLDISVFRGLKSIWDQYLTGWARKNIGRRLSKSEFTNVLGKTWRNFDWASKLKSRFKKTGIFNIDNPLRVNRNALPQSSYHPEKMKRLVFVHVFVFSYQSYSLFHV